jgi:hypothetical protein
LRETFELVTRRDVVVRALRVALLVGTVLIAINHGDRILNGSVAQLDFLKMILTYFVPYGVSTFSSVAAIRGSS